MTNQQKSKKAKAFDPALYVTGTELNGRGIQTRNRFSAARLERLGIKRVTAKPVYGQNLYALPGADPAKDFPDRQSILDYFHARTNGAPTK